MSFYKYLDISDRAELEASRQSWQRIYKAYRSTKMQKDKMRSDFQSLDNFKHISAAFELYIHAILKKLNYKLIIHPKLGDLPDFRVKYLGKSAFYLEAFTLFKDDPATKTYAALYKLCENINRNYKSLIQYDIEHEGYTSKTISYKDIWNRIESWQKNQKMDILVKDIADNHFDKIPKLTLTIDKLILEVIPAALNKDGPCNLNPIHMPPNSTGERFYFHEKLRKGIKKKMEKYNKPRIPFLLAINIIGDTLDDEDIISALFGDSQMVVKAIKGKIICQNLTRGDKAVWRYKNAIINARLSGILLFQNFIPSYPTSFNSPIYVANPYVDNNVHITNHDIFDKIVIDKTSGAWHHEPAKDTQFIKEIFRNPN